MQANLKIVQDSSYIGSDTWKWAIWLDGPKAQLDRINHVIYTLHRSFPNPVRTVQDRVTKFRLEDVGWSTFTVYVEIVYKDGSRVALEHELVLSYPEEPAPQLSPSANESPAAIRLRSPGPKRLLAIDGGGIRSVIAVEILAGIEAMLRKQLGNHNLVLTEYFDYVAGTSTGALLAACLAQGMEVSQIHRAYLSMLGQMFERATLLSRFRHKYKADSFAQALKGLYGEETLGSNRLRTLLMIVLKNASNDAAWFVTNNPFAKYNERERPWSELALPLWQVVRASTAAPVYFPPEVIRLGSSTAVFMDGTLTGFGNPAFQLFLRATAEPYRVGWPVGEDRLLLVSVGTGTWQDSQPNLQPSEMTILWNTMAIPRALMSAVNLEQDLLCRMFGRCLIGPALEREVGDMIGIGGPVMPKLFTYLRYDHPLDRQGLDSLGLPDILPEDVQTSDSLESIPALQRIGEAIAKGIFPGHYSGFLT